MGEMVRNEVIQMPEIKLKPCPFCGGGVIMMRLESLETGFVSYYVSHREFKCAYEIKQQSASETMQEAADKWNRRADE